MANVIHGYRFASILTSRFREHHDLVLAKSSISIIYRKFIVSCPMSVSRRSFFCSLTMPSAPIISSWSGKLIRSR